jgi:hypothetical protein
LIDGCGFARPESNRSRRDKEAEMLVYPIKWYRKPRRSSPTRSARDSFIAVPNVGQNDHIQDDRARHGGVEYGIQETNSKDDCATDACAKCGANRPIALTLSRYRDSGSIEHDWRCSACGNEWTTSTQVPT